MGQDGGVLSHERAVAGGGGGCTDEGGGALSDCAGDGVLCAQGDQGCAGVSAGDCEPGRQRLAGTDCECAFAGVGRYELAEDSGVCGDAADIAFTGVCGGG